MGETVEPTLRQDEDPTWTADPDADPIGPDYSGAESRGEAEATWNEEHLCNTCVHVAVCSLAQLAKLEVLLAVVTRCGEFVDAS
jgi:hypothetical protein